MKFVARGDGLPRPPVQRHGVGQRAVAVEDESLGFWFHCKCSSKNFKISFWYCSGAKRFKSWCCAPSNGAKVFGSAACSKIFLASENFVSRSIVPARKSLGAVICATRMTGRKSSRLQPIRNLSCDV